MIVFGKEEQVDARNEFSMLGKLHQVENLPVGQLCSSRLSRAHTNSNALVSAANHH